METISLLFPILIVTGIKGIEVYRSTLEFLDEKLSGLYFLNNQNQANFSQSFGLCLRFNYKKLGKSSDYEKPRIIYIPNTCCKRNFMALTAEYPGTWFSLGNYGKPNAYSTWVLFEPPDNFDIWSANKWHHLCITFEKSTSSVKLVKVFHNIIDNKIYRESSPFWNVFASGTAMSLAVLVTICTGFILWTITKLTITIENHN